MAKMKALRSFTDASTGKLVMEGSMFECDAPSAKRLESSGVAEQAAVRAGRLKAPKRARRGQGG